MNLYKTLWPIIKNLDPEKAHNIAISLLKWGLVKAPKYKYTDLQTRVFGQVFKNPVGLAAGFDKNAQAIPALIECGFGFVEVGTVTPNPQEGNPKPRLFRLEEDKAIINRMGFNNKGMIDVLGNVRSSRASSGDAVVGVNIGRNKETADEIGDYVRLIDNFYEAADYIAINISSPNTPGLVGMHEESKINALLEAVSRKSKEKELKAKKRKPILLKISPDVGGADLSGVLAAVAKFDVDGIIVCNTSAENRSGLKSVNKDEKGGLSGVPLYELSNRLISEVFRQTSGKLPIIGVGGITSGEDAYRKIRAGASLVQLYSSLIYEGMGNVHRVLTELSACLERDGIGSIAEAVGKDVKL